MNELFPIEESLSRGGTTLDFKTHNMKPKPKIRLKRTLFWAHREHLKEGRMLLLERKRDFTGMVRVRLSLAP